MRLVSAIEKRHGLETLTLLTVVPKYVGPTTTLGMVRCPYHDCKG